MQWTSMVTLWITIGTVRSTDVTVSDRENRGKSMGFGNVL